MSQSKPDENSVLLVHAYLDGELDPANTLGITQRIGNEPALAAEAERVKALQQLIHDRLPREAAPPHLHARIEASLGGLSREPARASSRASFRASWRALAASIAITAVLASGSTWLVVGSQQQPIMVADALVADHIRSLMASAPVDVVSSDRHTVKPWFNGRIPDSPRVVDLGKEDFQLVGGRIDVVGTTPVSTLVYRRAKHIISLSAVPASNRFELGRVPASVNGYNVVHWTENGLTYWAVSDLEIKELEEFARLFRTSQAEL